MGWCLDGLDENGLDKKGQCYSGLCWGIWCIKKLGREEDDDGIECEVEEWIVSQLNPGWSDWVLRDLKERRFMRYIACVSILVNTGLTDWVL